MSYTPRILVLGLGYVGLPLAIELSQYYRVVGFDTNEERVRTLINNIDTNAEYSEEELIRSEAQYVSEETFMRLSDMIIVTVPTPITNDNRPDVEPLRAASEMIGRNLSYSNRKPIVVFESTVYPGLTEELCVPIIEEASGQRCGEDFYVGYSPERVNPGDKVNTVTTITKVVAGMNEDVLNKVDEVYSKITKTHRASSIKVAEAAKVIENSQRDLNIAFVNELALIFDKLGIDTLDVLEAAGTKWNFLPFKPGLVGGHCISVDPYYLTWKAEVSGMMSQVIASGRKVNDAMPHHIVELITRGLNEQKKPVNGSNILILGATFKEDCKDTRNSKIEDIVIELQKLGAEVKIHDPFYENEEIEFHNIQGMIGLDSINPPFIPDGIVLAVAHQEYQTPIMLENLKEMMNEPVIVDLKGILGKDESVTRL